MTTRLAGRGSASPVSQTPGIGWQGAALVWPHVQRLDKDPPLEPRSGNSGIGATCCEGFTYRFRRLAPGEVPEAGDLTCQA